MPTPSEEWKKLQEALKQAPTKEAREEAAQAFREHERKQGKKSDPVLVSLAFKKDYPTAVRISDIPKELEKNPAFFEHLKKVVVEEDES